MAPGCSQLHVKYVEMRTGVVLWLFIRLAISSHCCIVVGFDFAFAVEFHLPKHSLCIKRGTSASITVACYTENKPNQTHFIQSDVYNWIDNNGKPCRRRRVHQRENKNHPHQITSLDYFQFVRFILKSHSSGSGFTAPTHYIRILIVYQF